MTILPTARDFYTGGKYAALNPTWHTADSFWKAKQNLRAIKQSGRAHATIAEIGCGPGSILNELSARLTTRKLKAMFVNLVSKR